VSAFYTQKEYSSVQIVVLWVVTIRSLCEWIPKFQRHMLALSSGSECVRLKMWLGYMDRLHLWPTHLDLEMEIKCSFETQVATYKSTWHYNPEAM
jgi:hypothetical protein